MDITAKKGDLTKEECDVLIINKFSDGDGPAGATAAVDNALDGYLAKVVKEESFKGTEGSCLTLRLQGKIGARKLLLIGLGKKEDFDANTIRRISASSFRMAQSLGAKKVVAILHGAGNGGLDPKVCAQAIVEGALLGDYTFDRYKKNGKDSKVESFIIVTKDGRKARTAQKGVELGQIAASAAIVARDLVNTPAEHMAPKDLVEAAKSIAKGKGSIRVRVFDKEQLKKMGAGGLLAISQGSAHEPYMVHMVYKPAKKAKKKICLVGKAVTFDSGGLSLKPGAYMETMKVDMGGSAVVLGLFSAIDQLNLNVEVHGIFGAVENMPSGTAIRPGDVVTAMNKKTIEILNTDAEGRVTLADTLTYAGKQKPDIIIDLATLTGACMVALGEEITGIMSNDSELTEKILEAANVAGEKMWELPLEKAYKKLIKSDIADVKNIGGRYGGALTAGLFLQEFVDPNTPWAHLDIAGPTFAERPMNAYEQKGATGHGVRTLIEYLRAF